MPYLVVFKKPDGKGISKGFSNRKLVSEFTGISYNTLTNHFVRDGRVWHYYEDPGLEVYYFEGMEKGRQRIKYKKKADKRNIDY